MSAMHPSRSFKGCAMCKPNKRRGLGDATRMRAADVRRSGGKRAVKRKDWM